MIKIECDMCGNEVPEDIITIEHTFGYNSPRDGDHVRLDLCEMCFDKILKNVSYGIDF